MIKVKFISIHDIAQKELNIDLDGSKTLSMTAIVNNLVEKTGIDFINNIESYMFMKEWEFLHPENFDNFMINDLDCLSVMHMVLVL